jgi:acyl-homoserine lactone acylase PvdQ
MVRRALLPLAVAFLVFAVPAAAKDYAPDALNIIPSGQFGGVPVPANADQQALMYDGLTPLFDQVTAPDLTKYFKTEALGAAGSPAPTTVEQVPRAGVTIVRDSFNVPHITGKTRDDVTWAAGWVTEEDRGLLLAQGRYPARFAALDAPGINAFGLVVGLKQVTVTKEADKLIDRTQTAALKSRGKEGRNVLHDVEVYVKGVNARLRAEKSSQKPWTRVDVYSINALAGQIFGQGGGDEVRRSQLLDALRKRVGKSQGDTIFNDLSEHVDKDTPVTIDKTFPYEPVPNTQGGNAVIDNGSVAGKRARAAVANSAKSRRYASNFLMVSANRSATGHPLFVAGPQIGYFYPGLTLELDLKGPGFEARGAAMPGGAGNILIGRGQDFAWSLTSAGSDTNDQFVETLCGGSDVKYMYKGRCVKMGRVSAGAIAGDGGGPVVFRTTVHGPVQGYATSGGTKVAISFKRSSYGKDILWQMMFRRMTLNQVSGLKSFYASAATSPFTFNVAYADDKNIATYSAGALPIRDKRVDPRLPTKGTGKYEWKGFLSANGHPHIANPPSGKLVNWNNKPAPGFGASDSEWSYGSIHRVQMLNAGIDAKPTHDLASVVGAMNKAATQDLRDQGSFLDGLTAVLDSGPPPSARAGQMEALLKTWRASGSSRLDRDLDGKMDAGAAPAIMDAVYPKVVDAVFQPVLGPQLDQFSSLEGHDISGGYTGGRVNQADKDLRQLTGTQFQSPFTTKFCGAGDLTACRTALWAAVDAAGNELATAQGSEDPAAWTSDANAERITFAPGLLATTIRFTNRPSGIQQVISFGGHRATRK